MSSIRTNTRYQRVVSNGYFEIIQLQAIRLFVEKKDRQKPSFYPIIFSIFADIKNIALNINDEGIISIRGHLGTYCTVGGIQVSRA
jgi:hypothetical protein